MWFIFNIIRRMSCYAVALLFPFTGTTNMSQYEICLCAESKLHEDSMVCHGWKEELKWPTQIPDFNSTEHLCDKREHQLCTRITFFLYCMNIQYISPRKNNAVLLLNIACKFYLVGKLLLGFLYFTKYFHFLLEHLYKVCMAWWDV